MAPGPSKRASMREGPLAALFRKTDEEKPEAAAAPPQPDPEPVREEPVARERPAVPHPGLRPQPEPAREEPRVPTPQERLRHAFSSEIPENVMERPAPSAPREDVYARSEPTGFGVAAPVGQVELRTRTSVQAAGDVAEAGRQDRRARDRRRRDGRGR